MPKKSAKEAPGKLRPDVAEIAFRVMREATGEAPKTRPGEGEKNPEAVRRGVKGGRKGGLMRAAKLGPKGRVKLARKAAKARWSNKPPS